jgi:voltage-gated potassium channel
VLCFLLAVYSFAVWGYITASLATFFVGRDAEHDDGEVADKKSIALLRADIRNLGAQLSEMRDALTASRPAGTA